MIKTSHKSIKQDYKIWKLENLDYIFNWLWYLKAEDIKSLDSRSQQNSITDTQTLVISLAKSLSDPAQDYTLYFDNLFNNISLAHALAQLKIEIMKTAQVNAIGLFLSIIQLKNAKKSLKWEYLKTAIVINYQQAVQPGVYITQSVDSVNTNLWQDNNWVLDMIIAYNYPLFIAS